VESKKVLPEIRGLGKAIPVDLGKRLEWIGGNVTFVCPDCGYEMKLLDDPADLEYGSFHGLDECWDCGLEFKSQYFDVKATVTITLKEDGKV